VIKRLHIPSFAALALLFGGSLHANILENFDASTAVPVGWVNGGSTNQSHPNHYQSPPNCRSLAAGQFIQTPQVNFPTNFAFYADASNAGNGKIASVDYNIDGGAWTPLASFTVSTSGNNRNYPLTSSPDLSTSPNVRFRFNSTFATWYLDNVAIATVGAAPTNTPPIISISPAETNVLVVLGNSVLVTVGASELDGDLITLAADPLPSGAIFDPNPVTGVAPLSGSLEWTPETTGDFSLAFSAGDKDGTNGIALVITVVLPEANLLLPETFDASSEIPPGWMNEGSGISSLAAHYQSPPYCRSLAANQALVTPPVNYPTNLQFYADASTAGSGQVAQVAYRIGDGDWTLLHSFAVSSAGRTESVSLTSSPDLSFSANVRFRFLSTFNTWYLDNVRITGGLTLEVPPVLAPIAPQMVALEQTLNIAVSASDIDGNDITLYASNLPPGAVFETVTHPGTATSELVYTPDVAEAGMVYTATVYAADMHGVSNSTFTISVFDALVGFFLRSEAVREDAGTHRIAATLSRPADVTVEIALSGSATEGPEADIVLVTNRLAFSADGSATQFVELVIRDDTIKEPTETAILTLVDASGADIGPVSVHTLAILDDDTLFEENFDADPGWSVAGLWAFGRPLGGGGVYGGRDPASGYSGPNVYGYNLAGNYPDNMAEPDYLTTTAIDCRRFRNVRLVFQRWLAVESFYFDHAFIQASRDNINWVDVWRNSYETTLDTRWTNVSYDLSSIADGESAVYIRWGMGPTDIYVNFGGWNIDDVVLEGEQTTNALFRFSQTDYIARETSAVAVITVERSGRSQIAAAVGYFSSDGSATAGLDYAAVSGILHFAAGELQKTFTLPFLDDAETEGEETVVLSLVPVAAGELGSIPQATLTLLDDESPGVSVPFFEGFETNALAPHWQVSTSGTGRIWLDANAPAAYEGDRKLCMDASDVNALGRNEAVLSVDLRGQTNVSLDFWEYNFDDEIHPMPVQFTGSVNADGVAVSADGLAWHRLFPMPAAETSSGYINRVIDLSAFIAGKGWSPGSHFKIKFQQYDRYPIPLDGRCFDNVQLYARDLVADIQMTMQQSENPATPGSNLVYQIMVTNRGPRAVSAVVVSNVLPYQANLVSVSTGNGICQEQDGIVTCELGEMAAGETITVTVIVEPQAIGYIVNTATVYGDTLDPNLANNRQALYTYVDEPGGEVHFLLPAYSASEDGGMVYVGVVRTQRTYGAVSVNYATIAGSALAGLDYLAATGTLHFASGQTALVIPVAILNDAVGESDETFIVRLTNSGGAANLGALTETQITIRDDDGVAAFPFLEDFESGIFSNYWRRYSSTTNGRIHIANDYNPQGGQRHVTMDTSLAGPSLLNELVLTVDLAGQQGVTLAFWHKHFNDEGQIMSATFSGRQNTDGVAISANGTNWIKVRGLTPNEGATTTYRRYEVALDPIVAAQGLSYNGKFMIKFQQYDNYPIASDGFAFDNIALFAGNGALRLSRAAYELSETGGVALVTVERVNGSQGSVTVDYATSNGTAVAGSDYTATSGTLVMSNGVVAATIGIPVVNDAEDELDEMFYIRLGNPTGGAILTNPALAQVNILDNDGPGTVQFAAADFAVVEGAGAFEVPVLRRGGSAGDLTVHYSTTDGTAAEGLDYSPATGTLVFADGVMHQAFTVAILPDDLIESSETILLALSSSGGVALGSPDTATLTIIDDEDPNYGYYQHAYGKTGTNLHAALHGIIRNAQIFDYDSVWTILREVDENLADPNEVLLVYKYAGRSKYDNGGSSGQWNREHVWPRSRGFSGEPDITKPPSVDVHHIRAADVDINSIRGNKDFVAGGDPVPGAPPTCRTTETTFEPPDPSKGDVARMILYMDVRYEGSRENEPDLRVVDVAPASGTEVGRLSQLIQWHYQDPPDAFEIRRNNLIHQNWQGNRNPFIDHPEWVSDIWGGGVSILTFSGANGTISPANPEVYYGSSQIFDLVPAPYYRVAAIWTNGFLAATNFAPGPATWAWNNVRTTGSVTAAYTALLATNGVPLWWLAQYGITNDVDTAALADLDDDGFITAEEYVAGTNPTDPASYLGVRAAEIADGPGIFILQWSSASNRTYAIWMSTNLMLGFADPLVTNVPATPPANTYTTGTIAVETPVFQIRVNAE
jgi:uncharacterized repeat protein (TIGR01451 family)